MWEIIKYSRVILFYHLILATHQMTGQLHERYMGCFEGTGNNQKSEQVLRNQSNLTIDSCIQKCLDKTNETQSEMTFAAVNNGRRCVCRNDHGQQLHDRHCNVKCSGTKLQFCGGNAVNRFYSLYTVCPLGYFGPNCDLLCHCKRQLPCDRRTGICPDGCDEKWNGTSCNISSVENQYLGCYGDGPKNSQSMYFKNPGGKTGEPNPKANSIEFCIDICSINASTYAGMQYGYDCFCGENYNRYGNKTHAGSQVSCNYPCPANGNQKCGGNFANSVYRVCPVGFYERGCANRCHCSDGGPCRFNGTCLTTANDSCRPGWTGPACNTRDCEISNGDCEPDEMCEFVDLGYANLSMCRCRDGLYRSNNTCRSTYLHYVGCYKGSTTQFVSVELPTSNTLQTIEFCILKCRQLNITYSIIQGGVKCLCGEDFGQISPDHECQIPCAGNEQQYCGGMNMTNETSIYVVYGVSDILSCSDDTDCSMNESCNVIDLQLMNVSRCRCKQGFHGMSPLKYCTDIDECQSNTSSCNPDAEYCVNNIGSYGCECKNGLTNITGNCEDVDECQSNTSSCNPNAEYCVNNIGSYWCECKNGFTNTTGNCEDVDECGNESLLICNIKTELCKNTIGSYTCQCRPGPEITTYGNCTDVNDRPSDGSSSPCDAEFTNVTDNYICKCKECFTDVFGKFLEINGTTTIGAILGTLLAISLIINTILIVSRINNAKARKPEPRNEMSQADFESSSVKILEQNEMTYDQITHVSSCQNSLYEPIITGQRQIVVNPNSDYAEIRQSSGYVNVSSPI